MNSGIDHKLSDKADEAAVWLAANWWKAERPLVPFLRKRLGCPLMRPSRPGGSTMKPPEIETAAPMGSIIGSGGNSKVITTRGTYPTFSLSAMDFAIATIAARFHLPAPTARVVVELAGIGGGA